jgi:hypothetical protein
LNPLSVRILRIYGFGVAGAEGEQQEQEKGRAHTLFGL